MSNNIAYKEYQKLSIQISLNGLSFFSQDTLHNTTSDIDSIDFSKEPKKPLSDQLDSIFSDSVFTKNYDSVNIIHENSLFCPVPTPLFDKDNISEYLKFSTKILPLDQYKIDVIQNHNIHNVYITDSVITEKCDSYFEECTHTHSSSILISSLLNISKNSYETQFFVHVKLEHFEIIVINRGKLLLINSFQHTCKEDFLYYTLFVAEQLDLNPEKFQLYFFGAIRPEDELHSIAYKYVRHVYLLDEHSCNSKMLDLKYSDCLKHFTLINS